MRRIATWLLVGAVAALGVAAAVDALWGGEAVVRESGPQDESHVYHQRSRSDRAGRA